jgi:hypothetical protein
MKRIIEKSSDLRIIGAALLVSFIFFLTMYGFLNHLTNELSNINKAAKSTYLISDDTVTTEFDISYIDQYKDYLEYIPKLYA